MKKRIKINKNLALLLGGQFISQAGDKFYSIALAYWILKETGSSTIMGIYLFCSMLPSVAAGFISGGIIDNFNRKTILVATDIIRGLIITVISVAFYYNSLSLWLILLAQILLSISQAFFNPAVQSILPQIVESEALTKANAKSQLISGITLVSGPVIGGITVAAFGYGSAFIFNTFSFFAAAVLEAFILLNYTNCNKSKSLKEDILAGYIYVLKSKQILIIAIIAAILHFFVGSIQVIMPFLANSLKGNGARNLGYLEMFFGFGVVLTAFFLSIKIIKNSEKTLFKFVFLLGIILAVFGIFRLFGLSVILPYLIVFSLFSCSVIFISTCYQTILQRNTDNTMAGRVFSVIGSIGNSTLPLASLFFGILLNYLRDYCLLIFCGIVIIILSFFTFQFLQNKNRF